MITKALLVVCLSLALIGSTQSTKRLECEHLIVSFRSLRSVYGCDVVNNISISSPDNAEVSIFTKDALHVIDKVMIISIPRKVNLRYFPRGMDKVYKNLKIIQIIESSLQEVHQSDLKPFPKLFDLQLQRNHLQILEKDLFKFNPNLEFIDLSHNSIKYVHPNVFDDLPKLNYLNLQSNSKIDMSAENNKIDVINVIEATKTLCADPKYSFLEQNINKLELELKKSIPKNFKSKLEYLENEMKVSNFINFFRERLEVLKTVQAEMIEPKTPRMPHFEKVKYFDFEGIEPKFRKVSIRLIENPFDDENENIKAWIKAFSNIPNKASHSTTIKNVEGSGDE